MYDGEFVEIFPELPTATNIPFPYVTFCIVVVLNPLVLDVHVMASVDVVNVPFDPTATYIPFP